MSEHDEALERDELAPAPAPFMAAMLSAYREQEDMPSDAKARVQRRLEAAPVVAASEPARAGSRGLWIGLAVAAVVAAIIIAPRLGKDASEGAGSSAEYQGSRLPPEEHTVTPAAERETSAEPERAPEPAPESMPEPGGDGLDPVADEAAPVPGDARENAVVRRKKSTTAVTQEPAPVLSPADSLAEETALLRRAQSALSAGEPRRALSILREHGQRFADGVLAEERRALEVVALCDDGQVERGRSQARAFLAKHPSSALRERVAAACPEASK